MIPFNTICLFVGQLITSSTADGSLYRNSILLENFKVVQEVSHQRLFYIADVFKNGFTISRMEATSSTPNLNSGFEGAASDLRSRAIRIDEFFTRITGETEHQTSLIGPPLSLDWKMPTPPTQNPVAPLKTEEMAKVISEQPNLWRSFDDCVSQNSQTYRAFLTPELAKGSLLCAEALPFQLSFNVDSPSATAYGGTWAEDLFSISSDVRGIYLETSRPFFDADLPTSTRKIAKFYWIWSRNQIIEQGVASVAEIMNGFFAVGKLDSFDANLVLSFRQYLNSQKEK